jgi:galactose mutarotase-like enzyme
MRGSQDATASACSAALALNGGQHSLGTCLPYCSISGARFSLDGKNYSLQANDGSSSIHGGSVPWAKAAWHGTASRDVLSATYEYTSVDGEAA